ncbi:hypothetical protein Scep_025292 [Stephania cephalantha]|uniref:Uncharacterized protein n=1 Tax=Stephania cephalantha TaxID=152367 RepID=A0AAP0HM72_9MAGN
MRKSCLCNRFLTRDENVNADTSKSVEFDKFSIVDEHLSEPEETLDVSSHEPDITIMHNMTMMKSRKKLKSFQRGRRSPEREQGRPTSRCW